MATNKRNRRRIRLTERDEVVLDQVALYGLTVRQAIAQLPCFQDSGEHAAASVARRLLAAGFLAKAHLYGTRSYYHLTKLAASHLGDSGLTVAPLKEEPKVRAFAILSFCYLQEVRRDLLSVDQFRRHFSQLERSDKRVGKWYIDTEGTSNRLAYLRVDLGRHDAVPVERMIHYCHRDASRILDAPATHSLLERDQLQLTLLTALAQKAKRLQQAIADANQPLPVPVRVSVIPELRELVAPVKY